MEIFLGGYYEKKKKKKRWLLARHGRRTSKVCHRNANASGSKQYHGVFGSKSILISWFRIQFPFETDWIDSIPKNNYIEGLERDLDYNCNYNFEF